MAHAASFHEFLSHKSWKVWRTRTRAGPDWSIKLYSSNPRPEKTRKRERKIPLYLWSKQSFSYVWLSFSRVHPLQNNVRCLWFTFMQMVDFIAGDRYMSKSETLINDFTYPHEKVFDIFFFFFEKKIWFSPVFFQKNGINSDKNLVFLFLIHIF
jgi:hypothetical protein